MRLYGLLGLISFGACAPRSPAGVPTAACEAQAPRGTSPFTIAKVEHLAGEFEIVTVDSTATPTRQVTRRVHLYVNDSLRRYPARRIGYWGGTRHLAGWIISDASDPYTSMLKSQDPDHPGVVWLGESLRIGDYDVLDGAGGDNLRVRWYSKHGFGGAWTSDMGFEVVIDSLGRMLPDPAGYFCARRLDAAS
jgi:hypothetical protein